MKRIGRALLIGAALAGPATAQSLRTVTFPDGSGKIGLAPGWKIQSAGNGAVAAAGPGGAVVTFGMPMSVVTVNPGVHFGGEIPDHLLFPGSVRVHFDDPVRATLDVLQAGVAKGAVSNVRLKAVEYVREWSPGRAAYVRYAARLQGKPLEVFGLYALSPIDQVQALFYSSFVAAPPGVYAKALPAMMAMWRSWSLSPALVRERLVSAQKALAQVDVPGAVDSVLARRRDAATRAARVFGDYIRGENIRRKPNGDPDDGDGRAY